MQAFPFGMALLTGAVCLITGVGMMIRTRRNAAVLANYPLSFLPVAAFVLLYDFVYMFPLILLYFGYNRPQGTAVIKKLELVLGRISSYIVPAAVSILGVFLIGYGVSG